MVDYAAGSGSHTEQRIKSDDGGGAGMKTLFVNESATFLSLVWLRSSGYHIRVDFPYYMMPLLAVDSRNTI